MHYLESFKSTNNMSTNQPSGQSRHLWFILPLRFLFHSPQVRPIKKQIWIVSALVSNRRIPPRYPSALTRPQGTNWTNAEPEAPTTIYCQWSSLYILVSQSQDLFLIGSKKRLGVVKKTKQKKNLTFYFIKYTKMIKPWFSNPDFPPELKRWL